MFKVLFQLYFFGGALMSEFFLSRSSRFVTEQPKVSPKPFFKKDCFLKKIGLTVYYLLVTKTEGNQPQFCKGKIYKDFSNDEEVVFMPERNFKNVKNCGIVFDPTNISSDFTVYDERFEKVDFEQLDFLSGKEFLLKGEKNSVIKPLITEVLYLAEKGEKMSFYKVFLDKKDKKYDPACNAKVIRVSRLTQDNSEYFKLLRRQGK